MGEDMFKQVASIYQEGEDASTTKSIIHADKEGNDVHDSKIDYINLCRIIKHQ